jgi:integrase
MPTKRKITKRSVDASHPDPQGKRLVVWDTDLTGFGLVVLPSGVKSYVYRYRTPEGRQRQATIGKHGSWTAEQARKTAEDMRATVRADRDPLAERRERRLTPTVGELLDVYVTSERFKSKAPSTQATDRGRIERHLKPLLGRKHIHILTPGDVERALVAIRDGRTAANLKTRERGRARVTGGPGTARMAVNLLRAAFNWAIAERMAKANPCQSIRTGPSGTRSLFLQDAADYSRLFATLDQMQQQRRLQPPVADAIRVIALTGARRGEIANLKWEHVDLVKGHLILPPQAHKTGRRTGESRIIGLPVAAQAVVAGRPGPRNSNNYVFPSTKGAGPIELSKPWRKIRTAASLPRGIGLHGLRHSLASHMAMNGFGAGEIMTALGHSQLSTAQRYVHWARDARQALSERAASVALAGLAASQGAPADTLEDRNHDSAK